MHPRRILLSLMLALIPLQAAAQSSQSLNEELIAAARKSNVEAVKTLLSKGADVNAKTEYGATPLFFACDRGNAEVVRILLDHGADPNVRDTFYKSTPLVWATQRDHAEVVKLLVNKNPSSKEMVLFTAVSQGKPKTTKALLDMGGYQPEALSTNLAMAEKAKNTEIIELLKKAGATPKTRKEYKVDSETLKLYEGVYKNEQLEMSFKVQDGKLIGGPANQQLVLIPVDQHTFEPDGLPGVTAIFKTEGEKVIALIIKQPSGEMTVKKVEVK